MSDPPPLPDVSSGTLDPKVQNDIICLSARGQGQGSEVMGKGSGIRGKGSGVRDQGSGIRGKMCPDSGHLLHL